MKERIENRKTVRKELSPLLATLTARATRTIVNHALIGKYRLRFFPREDFSCPYGEYPIEMRHYILHEYRRFNVYWNPRRDLIYHFILFLELNSRIFSFESAIT